MRAPSCEAARHRLAFGPMFTARFHRPALAGIALAALALAGCSQPDTAALEATDAALKGQQANGGVMPIENRVVMIGKSGPTKAACAFTATPRAATLTVHWSTNASAPPKTSVTGQVAVCDSDGEWTGIIFPTPESELDSCNIAGGVPAPREYQGPCRWGWVRTAEIKLDR